MDRTAFKPSAGLIPLQTMQAILFPGGLQGSGAPSVSFHPYKNPQGEQKGEIGVTLYSSCILFLFLNLFAFLEAFLTLIYIKLLLLS